MALADIRKNVLKLEAAVKSESFDDHDNGLKLLVDIKIAMTTLPALNPETVITEAHLPEIELARDVYELAALLSMMHADDISFGRHVAQAKTYYVDYAGAIKPSSRQNLILGLNLIRLMSENRIPEFHTELELIPPSARSDKFIDYALRLEHYLMEGSYSKIRDEKDAMPDPVFAHFVDGLMVGVRTEIAACCERAYERLKLESISKMLYFDTDEDFMRFCESRQWKFDHCDDEIVFDYNTEEVNQMDKVPSRTLINRSLVYATELEQII